MLKQLRPVAALTGATLFTASLSPTSSSPSSPPAQCAWGSFPSADPKADPLDDYPYFSPWHRSAMRRNMTPDIYAKLLPLKTSTGYTINDLIQCGCSTGYTLPRNMGVMTGDPECYTVFAPLLNPIIRDYHDFSESSQHVTDLDPTHLKKLNQQDLDPKKKYILSSRIRVSRSIEGIPFPAAASRSQMRRVESLTERACQYLSGTLSGMYVHLNDMTNEENDDLIQRHILFDNPDEWATQAGLGRNWPDARGVYMNVHDVDANPDFIVWINEEDHLRIMVLQKGGNIFHVFEQLVAGVNEIERGLNKQGAKFLHDDRLGFVTGCPTNLGTGMRASMHVKLIHLGSKPGFKDMCKRMGLEVRGKHGERDNRNSGIFDISNRHRLGYSEVELIQLVMDGVRTLIELEQKLEKGEDADCSKMFNAV